MLPEAIRSLIRSPRPAARHYHLLDVARGLAAVAILLWHYQHFIVEGEALPGTRGSYPLYSWLWPFYEGGGVAVQFFWIISGFVFAAVYCDRVPTVRMFFVSRFARLYPLHFVTLVFVGLLQAVSTRTLGRFLIYDHNDAYHFVLNLLFASSWGLEAGKSFNGPIWSVSLEIGIYALFWLILRPLFRIGVGVPALLALLFLVGFLRFSGLLILDCGFDFFAGCSIFVLSRALPTRLALGAAAALLLGGVGLWVALHAQGLATIAIFNGLVLSLAIAEDSAALSRKAKKLQWFGDCTYGLYLWHIPVQIAVLLAVHWSGIDTSFFFWPVFLLVYLLVMIGIARLSYLAIEAPSRRRLQHWAHVPARRDAPIAGP